MRQNLATWAMKYGMAIYSKNAGPTLSALISKAAAMDHKRVSLDDEIDLVRSTLLRTVEMWSKALEGGLPVDNLISIEALIRECTECVARLVVSQSKISLVTQGAIQLSSVSWVIGEVTRVIDSEIRIRDEAVADKIVSKIKEIKLPVDGTLERFIQTVRDEAFL
jgi:hypothetical protein